jgi:hypothetical protein
MWLVDGFRRRAYERQYRAAWVVLLADYTFRQLSSADQKRVRNSTRTYLAEGGNDMFVAGYSEFLISIAYVLTMHRLSIPPALPGTCWGVPHWVRETQMGSYGPTHQVPDRLPSSEWPLLRYYLPTGAATEAARRDLIAKGASFPEPPDPVDEMLKNRVSYLKEYEKKHGN